MTRLNINAHHKIMLCRLTGAAGRGPASSILIWHLTLPRLQVYDLEKKGGSIIAGVLKMMKEKKANPAAPRDTRLPPKPAGQTVGSFREGLQMLPEAIAKNLKQQIRCPDAPPSLAFVSDKALW